MQAASAFCGEETSGVVSDEDEEGGGKCDDQETRSEDEKLKMIMISPGQVDAVNVEVQRGEADTGSSSSE